MNIKLHITSLVKNALEKTYPKKIFQELNLDLEEISIERPHNPDHGDFASSLPLKLTKTLQVPPMEIANSLALSIKNDHLVENAEAVQPGFINIWISKIWLINQIETILDSGYDYGNSDLGTGKKIQIEFVSVNPTGPLHVGHARGAVFGSTLAKILEATGYCVQREYYINDAGSQLDKFNHSLYARYQQVIGLEANLPADGYQGEYLIELAQELAENFNSEIESEETQKKIEKLGELGLQKMIECLKYDMQEIRVSYDNWFSERTLFSDGQYQKVMQLLDDSSYLNFKDGATWFTSTSLGEDKDNVLVKSDGSPTYFATDIAYHYNKFLERKFDQVINIWGADHQGHVSRMKAAITALGIDSDRLTLLITQLVTLNLGNNIIKASKRSGNLITLRELVEEVGADACRYFFLARSPESQMEFDLDLAKKQSSENPVYYIQYAHARICSIINSAKKQKIESKNGDIKLLTHKFELDLIRKMTQLPELIDMMAKNLEAHHVAYYSIELATAFHLFYEHCRVISNKEEDLNITKARLKLLRSVKITLGKCLRLMEMNELEKM